MTLLPLSLYALAETGIFAVEFFVRLQLLIFYTDKIGLESYLASLAAGVALVWDAFIDPYVGSWSDRTTSRWGNRKPFLVAGALFILPSLTWLFAPYRGFGSTGVFFQLLCANLLLNTGITLVTVPHAAISAELSKDAAVRVRIFAARLVFANLGLVVGLLVPAALLQQARDHNTSAGVYPQIAALVGVFAFLSVIICVLSLKSSNTTTRAQQGFMRHLKTAFRNRFFTALFAAGFLAYIGVAINSTLARYYYDHYLKLNEFQFALVLLVFIVVWSLSAVLWVMLADRFGKDLPATLGICGLGAMTIACYPLFPERSVTGPLVAAVVGGIFTGCILLFDSFVADAADMDFAQSGEKREGLYFGLWKFGIKAARGVAVFLSGALLWLIGYRAGVTPEGSVPFRIALLFGPLVGSIFVLSGLLFYFVARQHKDER